MRVRNVDFVVTATGDADISALTIDEIFHPGDLCNVISVDAQTLTLRMGINLLPDGTTTPGRFSESEEEKIRDETLFD